MSNSIEKVGFMLGLLALVAADVWAAYSRCPVSPPVNLSMLAFGIFIQLTALCLIAFGYRFSAELSLRQRWRLLLMAFVLGTVSILMVRYAVLYSDAIGQPNWFKSIGLRCSKSA
ncbi:MAG: hypothetical protein EPO06_03255 [Burkholderiaceae bacterium]|nr:MAG: hypothetical protein EPO06_03255 [Burkholderiaceae bacterium]